MLLFCDFKGGILFWQLGCCTFCYMLYLLILSYYDTIRSITLPLAKITKKSTIDNQSSYVSAYPKHQQHGDFISCNSLCTASYTPSNLILGCYLVITILAVPAFYYSRFYSINLNVCDFNDSFILSTSLWNSYEIPSPVFADIWYHGTRSFYAIYYICF